MLHSQTRKGSGPPLIMVEQSTHCNLWKNNEQKSVQSYISNHCLFHNTVLTPLIHLFVYIVHV